MKKFISFVALSIFFLSCSKEHIKGSGNIDTQQRTIGSFTAVSVAGANNVFIKQGEELKVEVKGYANLIGHFETKMKGNTLQLGYPQSTRISNDNVEVYITMPILTGLESNGSSAITCTGIFPKVPSLEIKIAGSGTIKIDNLVTDIYTAFINGSGNIETRNVVAEDATVSISGSGNVTLTANQTLHVNLSGSGNVYYNGVPEITSKINGSGKLGKL